MIFTIIAAGIAAVIFYYIHSIRYWKNIGVSQGSLTFGISEMIKFLFKTRSFAETVEKYYSMFPGTRYSGLYQITNPILMIRDPELLKEITVKNFDHFTDHSNVIPENAEPLWARNLFSLKGKKWRDMRPILSPSFTSSKMRAMFVLISKCAENFSQHFLNKPKDIVEVELKDSFTRFTNDVIATASFGVETDSLENPDNQFYTMGKSLANFSTGIWNGLKFFLLMSFPKLFTLLKMRMFNSKVTSFFVELIEDTLETRKAKAIIRPDMIHLLMEAQKELEAKEEKDIVDSSFAAQNESNLGKSVQKELTTMDIAAQALIFFFAGFDTVSSLMCFMAYELIVQPDIQTRLRTEIEETLEDCQGNLTYEALLKMKYMDMVVSESLRKWPSAVAVDRECTKAYTIQPKLPGESPIEIKRKSLVWIPIYGIHRDPNIYPEPERFDPERFNEENKENIDPYSYIPFGLGPRNCIGSRFALLEIKIVFFYLLKNFELVPISKSQIPIKLSKQNFNLTAEEGFWFGLKKLKI